MEAAAFGAAGALVFAGAWAWTRNGWPGVCAVGLTLLLTALTSYTFAIRGEGK